MIILHALLFFSLFNIFNTNIFCVAGCRLYSEGAPTPHDKKCVNKYSDTYGVMHRLPDKYGNPYPTCKKCYIVVSKTANSNKDLTELYLKKVLFSGAGVSSEVTCDPRVCLLWDYFKAHSCPTVK